MKKLLILSSLLLSSLSFADIGCAINSNWSIQFTSGTGGMKFVKVQQLLKDGTPSPVDIELLQAYSSPSEFKARITLDGQHMNIRTTLERRDGEYAVYTGTLTREDQSKAVITCSQN